MVDGMSGEADAATIMEQMPYGLYIIGSCDGAGEPNGMMADWVMQVSFVPRLVAVSFENDAHTLGNIRGSHVFTINFIPRTEEGFRLAQRFAQPYAGSKVTGRSATARASVHHKLEGVPHQEVGEGCPVLDGAFAWLRCSAQQFIPFGDHTLVVASVDDAKVVSEAEVIGTRDTGWPYSG